MPFLWESWFWRGAQSAAFYYLACTPCTQFNDRKRKQREAKKAATSQGQGYVMREKDGGMQYIHHTLPQTTNPGWAEEIFLGPGPPPKRMGKKETTLLETMREKLSDLVLTETTTTTTTPPPDQKRSTSGCTSFDSETSRPSSSRSGQLNESKWNYKRYQRKDESLWGREIHEHSNLSKEFVPAVRVESGDSSCYYHRNPEVNDLHPPVVSAIPRSRAESAWMLQPPPNAAIMAGKESPLRGRADSNESRSSYCTSRSNSSRREGETLGRKLGGRIIEDKLARGESPWTGSSSMSRGGSSTSNSPCPPKTAHVKWCDSTRG